MEYSTKLVSNPIDYICVYSRVSTRKQSTDKKHGLSYQKDLCKSYIDKFYSSVINESYWEDVGSSYKSKLILKEMGEMIRKLKPNTLILVSEVSRFGRNYKMVENVLRTIEKKKSYVVSISENLVYGISKIKNKEFIHKVIDSEKESDVLSMRVKNTHSYIKRNGGYVGKAPFGYKIAKNARNIPILKENPEDFQIIDSIVNLSNDCYSYDEIANIMNTKNLFYKNKLWNSAKIKNILKKFYPEHMLLNISQNIESKINVIDDIEYMMNDDTGCIIDDDVSMNDIDFTTENNNKQQIVNAQFEKIIVTIGNGKNKKRTVSFETNNPKKIKTSTNSDVMSSDTNNNDYIKLRSGRIVAKF